MKKNKVYIIGEIGINHNDKLENCYKMIDAASSSGCDAVKLQLFKARNLYPKSAGRLNWKDSNKHYSYDIYKAVKKFEFPENWIGKIIKYCSARDIDLISSVFDIESARTLKKNGFKKIKISSYTLTNIPLIEYCAKTGQHLILSTGGATLSEIDEAVQAITKYHKNFSILHCSIQYPVALKDCNLGIIETLKLAFPEIAIGYSDHTKEISYAAVQAVYLGGKIIEKHITLDKNMKGPDHFFALEPQELSQMVKDVRQAEKDRKKGNFIINKPIYGSTAKFPYPNEEYLRGFAYMKLFAKRGIHKDEIIRPRDISILRPGVNKNDGLEPKYLKLFQNYKIKAKKNISFEDPITWDLIL